MSDFYVKQEEMNVDGKSSLKKTNLTFVSYIETL